MANVLTDPPFANDPPLKFNVNAKILGLVIGILAIIGLVLAIIALPVVFALTSTVNSLCSSLAVNCTANNGIFILALVGVLISIVGDALYAVGGFQMYNLNRAGKSKVIYGLAVNVVGGILQIIGYGGIVGFIFSLIIAVIVYYLVVISRFPGETPLVASPAGYGAPPPPPPPA
jgi:hypothetical protein